ncbi:MAG: ComF family protein [Gottschalkiaceae bacterium]|nr:MAG: ComF family protein [Gottschalkiaceae bacterium]
MSPKENLIQKISNTLLDLIFPEEGLCFICDKFHEEVREDHICSDCREELFFIKENRCPKCGKPAYGEKISSECSYCSGKEFYFTRAISSLEYRGVLRDTIHKYKFEDKAYMYKAFGELMLRTVLNENIMPIDIIVPVPLHRRRKAERGYNQSELLAKYLSQNLDIPLDKQNIKRIKRTNIQNKLDRLERQKNLKDAFKVEDKGVFKNKRVLLVDDIFTTGATVNECSRVIKECGSNEIIVITIATGRNV